MHRDQNPAHDRGAILVHVALALLGLLAFTTFVVDYGVLWVSRRHAQNSADAGALATALAFAFDVTGDKDAAKQVGWGITQQNNVFGAPPAVDVAKDINFITCPPGAGEGICVKVDVYRDPAHANPLPMFFGPLVGLTQQGVRATATARISGANAIRCTLPWAMADRWADNYDTNKTPLIFPGDDLTGTDGWSPNDLYEAPEGDVYKAPYDVGHTGWTTTKDYGRQLVLHEAKNQFSAGWSGVVDLPGSNSGDDYRDDIRGCNDAVIAIAKQSETCTGYDGSGTTKEQALQGCLGIQTGWMQGPSEQGVEKNSPPPAPGEPGSIISQDPTVSWSWAVNGGINGEKGGVVDPSGNLKMSTPRIRPLPVFDINHYMTQNCSGTNCSVKVANIIGFFVEGMCDTMSKAGKLDPGIACDPESQEQGQVVGRIVYLPGWFVGGGGAPVTESSFVKIVVLVR